MRLLPPTPHCMTNGIDDLTARTRVHCSPSHTSNNTSAIGRVNDLKPPRLGDNRHSRATRPARTPTKLFCPAVRFCTRSNNGPAHTTTFCFTSSTSTRWMYRWELQTIIRTFFLRNAIDPIADTDRFQGPAKNSPNALTLNLWLFDEDVFGHGFPAALSCRPVTSRLVSSPCQVKSQV